MNPLVALLTSLGPAILGPLLQRNDPASKALAAALMEARRSESPDKFYKEWASSPAAAGAINEILAGSNMVEGAYRGSIGAAGGESTGVGQAALAGLHAIPGVAMSKLLADAWKTATVRSEAAQDRAVQRAGLVAGTQVPNYTAQLLGGGLQALSPFLQNLTTRTAAGSSATQRPSPIAPAPTTVNPYFNLRFPR